MDAFDLNVLEKEQAYATALATYVERKEIAAEHGETVEPWPFSGEYQAYRQEWGQ